MNPQLILPIVAVLAGLVLLVWSSDRFVKGAAAVARHFGISPLVIGMVIIGFGTSLPEMLVSALSALNGSPQLALGNAYGSNIANVALILGVSGLIRPLVVPAVCLRRDLALLVFATVLSGVMLYDWATSDPPQLSRQNAIVLLALFAGIMLWTMRGSKDGAAPAEPEAEAEAEGAAGWSIGKAIAWVIAGLALLLGSSYMLVWGAVAIAKALGVSELVIGLTIVAVGTSLPELASAIAAARQGESDLAIGNILGSNLFNTLMVVGIAGVITPFAVPPEVLTRDYPVMFLLLLILALCGRPWRGRAEGRIGWIDGLILLAIYVGYNLMLFYNVTSFWPSDNG